MRAFFAMEKRGELPKGTAERWAEHTPNIKSLPKRVKKTRKHKVYGQDFVEGVQRNRMLTGVVPKPKNVNISLQTMKYLPGEMAKTTLAPFRWAGRQIGSMIKHKTFSVKDVRHVGGSGIPKHKTMHCK
jgi:hypothetical protein